MNAETPVIELIPVRHGATFDHWEMSHNGQHGGPSHYLPVAVQPGDSANFTYTIKNPGNITFSSDPIWIHTASSKPTAPVLQVIRNVTGQNSATLKFYDGNKDAGQLTYVLNFNNAPPLDPIINNGGGGPGVARYEATANFVWYAVGLVAILAMIAILVRQSRMSPASPANKARFDRNEPPSKVAPKTPDEENA